MFDLKFFGKKLKRCRDNQEYTYSEVSDGTGISIKRLEGFENGLLEPTGDEILILADFYKEDYKYFISNQQNSASESTELLYRKFGAEFSSQDKRAIQTFMYLCQCEQTIWDLLGIRHESFQPIQTNVKSIKAQAVQAAGELRKFLGYNSNNVINNIYDDLRKTGTHVFRFKLSTSKISGLFINHPVAGKCILVNYSEDLYRQNFTVLHEYAHSIFDTQQEYNVSFSNENHDPKEIRANNFAANFLVPTETIKEIRTSKWTQQIVTKVAEQLQVNVLTLLYRLKNIGIIDENELQILKETKLPSLGKIDPEFKGLTEKSVVAKKAFMERGLSSSYVRNCHEAYTKTLISRNKLSEILLVDEFELPELLYLYNLKLTHEL